MKKLAVLLVIICLGIFQTAYSKENNIYEISVKKSPETGVITMQLNSDYMEKTKSVKENNGSVYFDIKNAKLSDNLKTDPKEDISIVAQQIGSKVRIYLKGKDLDEIQAAFASNKAQPFDCNKMAIMGIILAFVSFLALRSYSATIRLTTDTRAIKCPMKTAINLNRQLYEFGKRRSPEIVLNTTNVVKQDIYVDFQYAKDRKNVKIAI